MKLSHSLHHSLMHPLRQACSDHTNSSQTPRGTISHTPSPRRSKLPHHTVLCLLHMVRSLQQVCHSSRAPRRLSSRRLPSKGKLLVRRQHSCLYTFLEVHWQSTHRECHHPLLVLMLPLMFSQPMARRLSGMAFIRQLLLNCQPHMTQVRHCCVGLVACLAPSSQTGCKEGLIRLWTGLQKKVNICCAFGAWLLHS